VDTHPTTAETDHSPTPLAKEGWLAIWPCVTPIGVVGVPPSLNTARAVHSLLTTNKQTNKLFVVVAVVAIVVPPV
jgi:hypothetical protein